jgi:glycosyltransferase involved in cell wall biosynthesis
MRIAHVVTVLTPDGAYGGPVRVAVNQARALILLGHEVTIFASAQGYTELPSNIDGVPVRLYPATQSIPGVGFAGLSSTALYKAVKSSIDDFDLWHIHFARDLVVIPVAAAIRKANVPYVLQCHGMVDETKKRLARPLDFMFTRKILRSASCVLTLTPTEEASLNAVAGPDLRLTRIPNGVPQPPIQIRTSDRPPEALFLARLQSRKRPMHFVNAAVEISALLPNSRFAVVGPDEGQGEAVRARIQGSSYRERIVLEGPLPPESTLARMAASTVYVLPAVDEPFPMTVLEAMSLALPVIVTDSCGLAPFIESANAGIVIDDRQESLTSAMQLLLQDERLRERLGENGRGLVRREFSMDAVALSLERHYTTARG